MIIHTVPGYIVTSLCVQRLTRSADEVASDFVDIRCLNEKENQHDSYRTRRM